MGQRYWTAAEKQLLLQRYPHEDTKDVAAALHRSPQAVNTKAHEWGVKKTPEALATLQKRLEQDPNFKLTRFVPGQTPPNKGQKMPDHVREKVKATMFHKDNKPHNWRPIGSERWVKGYLQIKVAEPRKWVAKNRVVWEQVNGPIPPKHIIRFKDKNPANLSIENLECVSMKQNVIENHTIYPIEIAQAVRLTNKINKLIKSRSNPPKENG